MNTPKIYFADDLDDYKSTQAEITREDSSVVWCMARPIGLQGTFILKRVKAAWLVFTGRADVLRWRNQ